LGRIPLLFTSPATRADRSGQRPHHARHCQRLTRLTYLVDTTARLAQRISKRDADAIVSFDLIASQHLAPYIAPAASSLRGNEQRQLLIALNLFAKNAAKTALADVLDVKTDRPRLLPRGHVLAAHRHYVHRNDVTPEAPTLRL
jgi:hypothetical protein